MGRAELFSRVVKLFFPSFCLHCQADTYPLCLSCSQLLELLPPQLPVLSAFEDQGPARTLVRAFQQGKSPQLAEPLAGYMALQYLQTALEMPSMIVPVPQSLLRSFEIGYNPALLLAQQLSRLLKAPVVELLKRKSYSQLQLKLEPHQRRLLSKEAFQWRRKIPLRGQTILLVDDLVGTGTTLKRCQERLSEGFPAKVIALTAVRETLYEIK